MIWEFRVSCFSVSIKNRMQQLELISKSSNEEFVIQLVSSEECNWLSKKDRKIRAQDIKEMDN